MNNGSLSITWYHASRVRLSHDTRDGANTIRVDMPGYCTTGVQFDELHKAQAFAAGPLSNIINVVR